MDPWSQEPARGLDSISERPPTLGHARRRGRLRPPRAPVGAGYNSIDPVRRRAAPAITHRAGCPLHHSQSNSIRDHHAFGSAKTEATETETEERKQERRQKVVAGSTGATRRSCCSCLRRVGASPGRMLAIGAGPLPPVYLSSIQRVRGNRVGPVNIRAFGRRRGEGRIGGYDT